MGRRDTESRAFSEIKELVKIALRTADEGQIKITMAQIEKVIRDARTAGQSPSSPMKE